MIIKFMALPEQRLIKYLRRKQKQKQKQLRKIRAGVNGEFPQE